MSKLILIDGNSLLFRAYFAMMRPMVNSKGVHTQGIFAFINMLNKILAEHQPTHIAVAFDMREQTFRHEQYSDYKGGRNATPLELLAEIPLMHQVLEAMNIKILEMPRYEADDLIGTVAAKANKDGIETLIITGDKDELQLVDEHVNVLINKKGVSEFDVYDIAAMKERYNLTPQQFIDLKGLMGDSSDNYSGVPGIGEKKGISLLEQYETLEGVLEHADEIKGKMGENIRDNIEEARLSKWLATIKTDCPIDFTWDELQLEKPDYDKLINIYTELEFSKFIKELSNGEDHEVIQAAVDYSVDIAAINEVDFSDFIKNVKDGSDVVIDVDTDDNHLDTPEIKSICLYSYDDKLFTSKEVTALDTQISIEQLADKKFNLIGFDLKKSLYSLLSYTDSDFAPVYDVLIAEYLIDPNRNKYLMDKLMLRYNGCSWNDEMSTKDLLFHIAKIKDSQFKVIEEMQLDKLFIDCEMPLVLTLAEIELSGILVNKAVLDDIGVELADKITELETEIYAQSGSKFNINSPKQLGTVLFDDMNLPYPKAKAKTGYSTAADILDKLKFDHKIVADVLEYRKVSKLKSTYVDGLTNLIASDGKIHPHFQQTVTATGRLSCTDPNLQNIPVRDDYGRLIRKAFIAAPGNIYTGSDYSQIELRVLASLSGDESMITAFKEGKDIHRATAARVFNLAEDEVTPLDRSKAKAVNFGVVYGMSGFGLSENLNISRAESQQYINDYFDKHAAVKDYLDNMVKMGEENREVRTHYGRIRQIPEFASSKYMEREFAKRLAMNTPIQGTAADIIKFAMNSVYKELKNSGLKSRLILQIHDELIVEGPEDEAAQVKSLIERCMTGAADLVVSLTCDTHTGTTWYELK